MPRISPERWALVRRLYGETDFTIAEIAHLVGLSEASIYRRAKKEEGWRRRSGGSAGSARTAAEQHQGLPAAGGAATVDRAEFARRLWTALDRHLKDLEGAGPTPGDGRAGQTLSTLTRTLEKLIEVERDLEQELEPSDGEVGGSHDVDVDALLAELAGRIEALP